MGDIKHLKGEIEKLNPTDQAELRAWYIGRDNELWDQQIAADFAAGKLASLITEAVADRAAGKSRRL